MLQIQYTYEPHQVWYDNMELFANKVMPALAGLVPDEEPAAAAQ